MRTSAGSRSGAGACGHRTRACSAAPRTPPSTIITVPGPTLLQVCLIVAGAGAAAGTTEAVAINRPLAMSVDKKLAAAMLNGQGAAGGGGVACDELGGLAEQSRHGEMHKRAASILGT